MTFPYYSATPRLPDQVVDLPPLHPLTQLNVQHYLPDDGLVDAVNVALLLGQPLLLTGEAGTGKTQLAYHLARQLGLGAPLKFETKSSSTARDLFYFYDHLRHFQAAQTKTGSSNSRDYLTYHALGAAILRANPREQIADLVSADFQHAAPARSVVLIDEIDKAQRDFPNDILNEVEGMYFKIPELGNVEVRAPAALRPVLILTSNSEKHLPAAFLRRCVYYHLPFPTSERLQAIVKSQLQDLVANDVFLQAALQQFEALRAMGLQKPPATAELLNWLTALKKLYPDMENPLDDPQAVARTLPALIKNSDDLAQINARAGHA